MRRLFALAVVMRVLFFSLNIYGATVKLHPTNDRYLVDMNERPLVLFGHQFFFDLQDNQFGKAHTYNNQDKLDWNWYIDFIKNRGMNFVRGWNVIAADDGTNDIPVCTPLPYLRTGPGKANDGLPKFDLDTWDAIYFSRLSSRTASLQANGIYYSFMFFDVYGMGPYKPVKTAVGTTWDGCVFNRANNINGVDADTNGDGCGLEFFHSPGADLIFRQEAYIRKVVDTLNGYDNVIWELCNELGDTAWTTRMVDYIRRYEQTKPKQHLILVSSGGQDRVCRWSTMSKERQLAHNGDMNSITGYWADYKHNPPIEATSRKPMVMDQDHIDPANGTNKSYVTPWKALTRGYHYVLYDRAFEHPWEEDATWDLVRRNVGLIASYNFKFKNLGGMAPSTSISSTTYCLYNRGVEYMIVQPCRRGGRFYVDVAKGRYGYEWIRLNTARIYSEGSFTHEGGDRLFDPPLSEPMALYVYSLER